MSDFNSASFYGDEAQDLRGPPGDKGDKGDQGDPGPRGEQGKDALTLWLEAGNTGTIEDYLAAQQGPQGRDGKSAAYRFGTFATNGIQENEILMDHDVATACTIAADFVNCIASCTTPPLDAWVASISHNDVVVGYLTIATDGSATFSSTAALSLVRGDTVTLTAPDGADEEIQRVRVTFVADLPDLVATPNNGAIG